MASSWASELNGGDDEEAALRQAIAMSLLSDDSAGPSNTNGAQNDLPVSRATPPAAQTTNPLAALGLDRKKMEEERLARLKKRKAEIPSDASSMPQSDANAGPPARRPRLMDDQPARVAQAPLQRSAPGPNSNSHRDQYAFSSASASAGPPYYKGAVLRTWARGTPRDGDIKIEEVFQKEELELAVLSSYQWDEDWLMGKLDMRKTKILLIAYAEDDETKAAMRKNVPESVIRFVFPPMQSFGVMHSKLQLLKYPKYLRVVVPTGNLVPYDWGETGTMENMVFLIDVPRIEDPANRATRILSPFAEELSFFLEAQGVDKPMIDSLRNYDFSETSRYGFVHTIVGSHSEPDIWQRTGYPGLGRTVKALGLDTTGDLELDYVCSSIGAVKRDLLAALYNACQGDSGLREFETRTGKPKMGKGAATPVTNQLDLSKIRVYYPSRETVVRSRGGTNSAGTICFQSKHWTSESFPHEILRDCKNVRSGVLMHSKVMFVQRPASSPEESVSGWAYVGSHNLSESAWGRLVKDRDTKKPKLNARNWECGVVLAVPNSTAASASRDGDLPKHETGGGAKMLQVFRGSAVPIPMDVPGHPFCDDERRPWFSDES